MTVAAELRGGCWQTMGSFGGASAVLPDIACHVWQPCAAHLLPIQDLPGKGQSGRAGLMRYMRIGSKAGLYLQHAAPVCSVWSEHCQRWASATSQQLSRRCTL